MADSKHHQHLKTYSQNKPNNGRPVELTESKIKTVCGALRMGIYPDTAFKLAGLSTWMIKEYAIKAIERPESIFAVFVDEMKKAIAEAELRDLAVIDEAAQGKKGIPVTQTDEDGNTKIVINKNGNVQWQQFPVQPDWKAAAWKLERRFKNKWAAPLGLYQDPIIDDDEQNQSKERTQMDIKELAKKVLLDDPDAE